MGLLPFLRFLVSAGPHSNDAGNYNHEQKSAGNQKVVHIELSFLSDRLMGSPDKNEHRVYRRRRKFPASLSG